MNIVIVQERSRHQANWQFRESMCMARALGKLGHQAFVWGRGYSDLRGSFQAVLEETKADAVLLLENYDNGWVPDLSACKVLKVMWSIDSHCALKEHMRAADRHRIDILLNATEVYLPHFERPGRKCHWFPNCYDDELLRPMPDVPKTVALGFCGNYVNRKDWIQFLQRAKGLQADVGVLGDDMVRAINGYRIHFNRNMADDINYRTFETLGCRTMLLTNATPNLERLFDVGVDLATYTSPEDLLEKVDHYLTHDAEREAMAARGYETVKAKHTYLERAKLLVELLGGDSSMPGGS
ncbi:glycosyltransferase [Polyangium sp. 6x1]|uniref:CgeB family protein n=1 Tax=Polyangium sp. 6x1 TaxID=3042689 RepID=UPI00248265CC|nr:glycosyltransferase [Polyangium sp. 6x1]MDI1443850.1 glycosyltransferase [Polyangium sp. 6x1]